MTAGEIMHPMPLDLLLQAAQQEEWDTVDGALSAGVNDRYIGWALESGLDVKDPNLRDLAASIIEKSDTELEPGTLDKLMVLVVGDENLYVRFRAAFALFSHGSRDPKVMETLRAALKDEDDDVVRIARDYLGKW